ncbi:MAG: hypothetical protein AAB927_00185 [Patescibacteria group bacterium]
MSELVMFQTHWRCAFENPPRRLKGWYERAACLADIPTEPAEVIILPVIRIERHEGASGRTGGYPRESQQLKSALKKADEAVARVGKRPAPVIFEPLTVKLRRKKPLSKSECTVLSFPFRLRAALRPPCRIMAPATFLPAIMFGAV